LIFTTFLNRGVFPVPNTIFDGGDKIFVLIKFEATAHGKNYSFTNNGHLWQFNAVGNPVTEVTYGNHPGN